MELKAVREIVEGMAVLLFTECERLEIAGSIRRGKAEVKDGEIVAIGKPGLLTLMDDMVAQGIADKALYLDKNGKETPRWGTKYRGLQFRGMKVEVFIAEPDNWGYQLWLRTGPAEANKWLMQYLAFQKAPVRAKEGYWWHGEERLRVASEEEQFRLLGMRYVTPAERTEWMYQKLLQWNRAHHWPDFSTFSIQAPEQMTLLGETGFVNREEAAIAPDEKALVWAAYQAYMRGFNARLDAIMARADRGEALLLWEARYVRNRRECEAMRVELVSSDHELELA